MIPTCLNRTNRTCFSFSSENKTRAFLKISLIALGVILSGIALGMYLSSVNVIASYALWGLGGTLVVGVALKSLLFPNDVVFVTDGSSSHEKAKYKMGLRVWLRYDQMIGLNEVDTNQLAKTKKRIVFPFTRSVQSESAYLSEGVEPILNSVREKGIPYCIFCTNGNDQFLLFVESIYREESWASSPDNIFMGEKANFPFFTHNGRVLRRLFK